ncbi:Membrane protein involved in the export of O-antigen and teichoic acid [Marinitoga hydrogenitolerans DSM 16785]|uniref:Membrane protein involved in the export of O-antigen and teichoic acid n=2 Tax=Marinitoga TaxID=160798 RepID=A0A1M4ZXQ8_MARH1|nr:Membrane protein involved in the export of O-antigen and teichoic acid [Marinitoga hydrogenitolerans DSM 16785]
MATDFILKGMTFITIPIFTRLLTVEEYGIVSLYNTFVSVFAIITGLDLNASIGTGVKDFREKKKEFLSSTLFLSLISFLIQFLIIILFKNQISSLFNIRKNILILAVISGYLSVIFQFYFYIKIFEKDYKKRSLVGLIYALLKVGLSIWLLLKIENNKYMGRIYGDLISNLLLSSILFLIITLKGKKLIWPKAWKYSLLIGVPLILHNLSGIVLNQFDRLVIQKIIGSEKVGLYSYAYTLGMIPLIILGATKLAWGPWFYDKMYEGMRNDINIKSKYYNEIYVIILSIIFIVTPELGLIMAPHKYNISLILIPIIVASYYMQFLYTIFSIFAFFYKKTGLISIGTVLAGIINIVLNILLIPKYGYEMAAITTLISYFFLLFFHALNVRYNLKDKTISAKYIFGWAFLIIVLGISQYLIAKYFGMFSFIERLSRIVIFGVLGIVVGIKLYKKLEHHLNK